MVIRATKCLNTLFLDWTWSSMVVMTYVSYFVRFLSLVKIIPGGKSTLVDRIALIIWTVLSVVVSLAFMMANWEIIESIFSYKISVSSIFNLGSFVIPCLIIVLTLPALHHLVSYYPHVLTDTLLPSLQHSWLFLANTVLCCSVAVVNALYLPIDSSFYMVKITSMTYFPILMIISSFIIGICTSQIRTKMEKNALVLLTKDSATEILKEFQELKAGMSPLLFMVFSTKCINIIYLCSALLSFDAIPKPAFVIVTAYYMMDLFYITTALHQTYNDFKAMSLKLR